MLLKQYIKQILCEQSKQIAEALSQDAAYKARIKSLFEQFLLKFSASYIEYRKQNYPRAWTVNSLFYAEDFQRQCIKLLYNKNKYINYALIFEHEGSVYIANDKIFLANLAVAAPAGAVAVSTYWYKNNYLFKLSISEFETALDVADNYDEFIALCEQLNEEYKEEQE